MNEVKRKKEEAEEDIEVWVGREETEGWWQEGHERRGTHVVNPPGHKGEVVSGTANQLPPV